MNDLAIENTFWIQWMRGAQLAAALGHIMFARGITRRLTTLFTALALCVQSVAALPVACDCPGQAASLGDDSPCCRVTQCDSLTSCPLSQRHGSQRHGCASREDCSVPGDNSAAAADCCCGGGHDQQEPYAPAEKNESGRDQNQQHAPVALAVVTSADGATRISAMLEWTHAAQSALPSVQVQFCVWLT